MSNRRLGVVREALTAAGMDLTYAYEDLVFLEHNGFMLQFTDKANEILIHKNVDADENDIAVAIALLQRKAEEVGLTMSLGRSYRLSQGDEENIQIEFC